MSTPLAGRIAVVTGASAGIGAAIAAALAGAGARVIGLARTESALKSTLGGLAAPDGTPADWACVDLADPEAVAATFERIEADQGRIDILVANAGRFHSIAGVHEADPADWWRDVTVNLYGTFLAARAVLPGMMARNAGSIVTMDGGRPIGGSAYAASKAGIVQLTQVLADEMTHTGHTGIRVLCANPGLNRTAMTEYQRDSAGGQRWIPGVGAALDEGAVRDPSEIAARMVEVLATATPADNGRVFDPDGWTQ